MTIESFIPATADNARQRIAAFIEEARCDCAAFGRHLDWDSAGWNVTAHCSPLAGNGRRSAILYFTTHENGSAKGVAGRVPMSEPFASFIKAVVRRRRDASPLGFNPLARVANAARDLHDVLADRAHDPGAYRG